MAEDLADYLIEVGIKTHYLHSEIKTLQRSEILSDLRLGIYDVVVGINCRVRNRILSFEIYRLLGMKILGFPLTV